MRFCSFVRLTTDKHDKRRVPCYESLTPPKYARNFLVFSVHCIAWSTTNLPNAGSKNTNTKCRNAVSVKQSFFLFWYYLLGSQTGFLHFVFHFLEFFTWVLLQSNFPICNSRSEITVQRRISFQIKNKEVWLRWQGGLETQAWIFKPHRSILLWILLPSLQKILG